MSCAACVRRVERALGSVPGVSRVQVNLADDSAQVDTCSDVELGDLAAALSGAGYELRAPDTNARQDPHAGAETLAPSQEHLWLLAGSLLCHLTGYALHSVSRSHNASLSITQHVLPAAAWCMCVCRMWRAG